MAIPKVSRVLRPRQAARLAYDRLSRWYDLFSSSEERFTRLALELLSVKSGERVLEIGFGTGKGLMALAQACRPDGRVTGVDLSWGMLAVTRRRLIRADLAYRANLHMGDGVDLPYRQECFDAVFLSFTLELFDTPDIPLALQECRRVLRPGGRLGVVAMALPEQASRTVRVYEWFHRRFPAVVDCRPIPAMDYIAQAGFQITRAIHRSMWGLPVAILLAGKI